MFVFFVVILKPSTQLFFVMIPHHCWITKLILPVS